MPQTVPAWMYLASMAASAVGSGVVGHQQQVAGEQSARKAAARQTAENERIAQRQAAENERILQRQTEANEKAAEKARQEWKADSTPSPETVQAMATENRGALAQGRLASYQNLATQMAARGFGSGSGLMLGGAKDIERSYLQTLGKQATDLTKFANTPMWGPPASAYPGAATINPVSYNAVSYGTQGTGVSGLTASLGKGTDYMDTAMGYYMMSQLLKS